MHTTADAAAAVAATRMPRSPRHGGRAEDEVLGPARQTLFAFSAAPENAVNAASRAPVRKLPLLLD